jgi:CRP/FNR family transcriptional regulator, dissimilatory nitrate respiration regulator
VLNASSRVPGPRSLTEVKSAHNFRSNQIDDGVEMILETGDAKIVRKIPLFSGLSEEAFSWLLAKMQPVSVAAGQTLFLQDEPASRFFVLLDGWVKLSRLAEDGTEAIVNVIAPGETFAEAAVFAQESFPVCAEAVTDARALALGAEDFGETIAGNREIAFAILGSLSLRLRQLVRQIEHLQVKSAPQRVADFLLNLCPPGQDHCTLALPLHKGLIARRLGMRPETFSRAMARLKSVGVEPLEGRVKVASVEALRRFSDEPETDGFAGSCK